MSMMHDSATASPYRCWQERPFPNWDAVLQSGFSYQSDLMREPWRQRPLARGDGDLPLSKPVRSAIVAIKTVGIRRMAAEGGFSMKIRSGIAELPACVVTSAMVLVAMSLPLSAN